MLNHALALSEDAARDRNVRTKIVHYDLVTMLSPRLATKHSVVSIGGLGERGLGRKAAAHFWVSSAKRRVLDEKLWPGGFCRRWVLMTSRVPQLLLGGARMP